MKRTVLVVDDEQNMQKVMRMILEAAGYTVLVESSAEQALRHLSDPNLDVLLTDLKMPGIGGEELAQRFRHERPEIPVIVVTAHGTIRSAVDSIRAGASDYLAKPFEPEELEIAVHNALRLRDILTENRRLQAVLDSSLSARRLIGKGPAFQKLMEEIHRVAPYKTSVLISGESGTGKELVARALHDYSPRAAGAWVAINCSAIPRDLLESELFGYVKGAFTGASQTRAGRLEQAQGGSLFLDEIGDMDLSLQAKLLRVLQEREFSPLGSDQMRKVDVRVIAASNRDLKKLVSEGRFREDLFYRLDVYNILAPPLRSRTEDIPLLIQHFLHELVAETGKSIHGFSPAAQTAMVQYPWPGNVRELRNAVERALLTCRGHEIDLPDLPGAILTQTAAVLTNATASAFSEARNLDNWLEEQERRLILEALAVCKGVQAHAARRLGISERSLWHRIKKLNIQINRVIA